MSVIFVIKNILKKDVRVRDHCHITGKYRGSAHQDCNIREIKIHVYCKRQTSDSS